MIAYEELVSALAVWRERNGLPVGSADYLGAPPPPTPVSFGNVEAHAEDVDLFGDDGDDGEISADDAVIGEDDAYAETGEDAYAEPPADGYAAEPADGYAAEPAEGYAAEPAEGYAEAEPAEGYADEPAEGYADENAIGDADVLAESPDVAAELSAGESLGAVDDDATSFDSTPAPEAPVEHAVDELQVVGEESDEDAGEVAIDADDSIIGEEEVAQAGSPADDVTAPQDYHDDPSLYPAVDEGAPASGDAEEVAFISNAAPTDEAAASPDLSDFPPLDATQQGIAPAPPAPGDGSIDTPYPEVEAATADEPVATASADDPTVEGFQPLTEGELGGNDDGTSQ